MNALLQDSRYALRQLIKTPGVTLVALLSLAFGIGANTAIFSLIDSLMLKSLPVREPPQLVLFGDGLDQGISDGFPNPWLYSYPFYREMRKRNQVFSDVAAAFSMVDRVHGFVENRSEAEPMSIQLVSGTYFPMLGVRPLIGRMLSDEDDRAGGDHPVAVVSSAWWNKTLGRDPSVLQRKLTIGTTVFAIVGVAPPEFFGTTVGEAPDFWIPLSMQKMIPPGWDGYNDSMFESLHLMARLKPGVSMEEASANANLLFQEILRSLPGVPLTQKHLRELQTTHVQLTSMANGFSRLRYQFSEPLKVLMALVVLVLLIACANIANLLLARSSVRARELAVRQALGAARSRLVRQLLTESVLLALIGGVLGIFLALVGTRLLLLLVSDGRDALNLDVSLHGHLLLFTLGISVASALLFGAVPTFQATRLNLNQSLSAGRNAAHAPSKGPLARLLVVSQVALSLMLLAGAGMFVRSLINLMNVDAGFDRENVIRVRIDPSSAGYREDARLTNFYQQAEQKLNAIPGVKAASCSLFVFNEGTWNNSIWVGGYPQGHQDVDVHHNVVGNGYFAAMGIPLLAGRSFGPQDTASSTRVGIISETMARKLFPEGSPIGQHYGRSLNDADSIEVIGVAKDVKYNSLDELQQPGDYLPYSQNVRYLNDFEIRYTGETAAAIHTIRQAIHEVDRNLPISEITTLDEHVSRSVGSQRLVAQLSAFFGFLALFLCCIGIYGLISYLVTRRVNEIGVRIALGARRLDVLWFVMRESVLLAGFGIAIGIPTALAGDRFISGLLFGLHGIDFLSLLIAVALLACIAGVAGFIPARRATKVDPMVALRYE
jgi:predicted permease